jgi:hypothetical protein
MDNKPLTNSEAQGGCFVWVLLFCGFFSLVCTLGVIAMLGGSAHRELGLFATIIFGLVGLYSAVGFGLCGFVLGVIGALTQPSFKRAAWFVSVVCLLVLLFWGAVFLFDVPLGEAHRR